MDLSFDDASINGVSCEEILSKITELDILKFYCSEFKSITQSFCSDLRNDRHPSCRIYHNGYNYRFKDFGNGDNFNCWNYVMQKFNCSFVEALNIVSCDFNIKNIKTDLTIKSMLNIDDVIVKFKTSIEIISQPWSITDFNYWNDYCIDFETLNYYNVVAAKNVILNKNINERYIFNYKKTSPKYGYIFSGGNKIYSPLESGVGKWMKSGEYDFEGWDQLNDRSDYVILTKGLKDVMCYYMIDINAVSLPSETSRLTKSLVGMLKSKFNKIIINLDNDRQGIESTDKIVAEFGFDSFYVDDNCKDFSDYVKMNKLEKAKNMIYGRKIKACI